MSNIIQDFENQQKKSAVVDVRSGDVVRIHQKIREGGKERIQVFEGLVIRTDKKNSLLSRVTVRRVTSGVGVEKSYLLHSPLVTKVEVVKRSKVRRKYLSYMRELTGKSARLTGVNFDKEGINAVIDEKALEEERRLHEEAQAKHEAEEAKKAEEEAKTEAKVEQAIAAHDEVAEKSEPKSEATDKKPEQKQDKEVKTEPTKE